MYYQNAPTIRVPLVAEYIVDATGAAARTRAEYANIPVDAIAAMLVGYFNVANTGNGGDSDE